MKCPECGAAMDLFNDRTWNAHWVCPFDGQIVWPPGEAERHVRGMLSEVYESEGVDIWMSAHHRRFGGRSAQELLDAGDHEPVLGEVNRLVGGAW